MTRLLRLFRRRPAADPAEVRAATPECLSQLVFVKMLATNIRKNTLRRRRRLWRVSYSER